MTNQTDFRGTPASTLLAALYAQQAYMESPEFIRDVIADASDSVKRGNQDSAWIDISYNLPETSAAKPVIAWLSQRHNAGDGIRDYHGDFSYFFEGDCLAKVGEKGGEPQYAIRTEAAEQIAKDMGIDPKTAAHGIGVVADLLNRAEARGYAKYVLENVLPEAGIQVSPERIAAMKELKAHGIPRPY